MKAFTLPTSLSRRLSRWLAIQTLLGLTLLSIVVYAVISNHLQSRQQVSLSEKKDLVLHLADESRQSQSMDELRHQLEDFMTGHHELTLEVRDASNQIKFQSSHNHAEAQYVNQVAFEILLPGGPEERGKAVIQYDGQIDSELLKQLAATLALVTIIGSLIASWSAYRLVKKGLKPVDDLAVQTAALNVTSISSRLDGSGQPDELQPLVNQFNQLLDRLSASYSQLEHFNADVAHELNTPLTTLITSTELALRKPKERVELTEVLGSNLEELDRMSGIVKDMLFLSHAERGSVARCTTVPSLAMVANEVVDYHEAEVAEAALKTKVHGDAAGEFDVQLIKRALSNLLSNAISYADPATTVDINISQATDEQISVTVVNSGTSIPDDKINHIFDRFYRVDESRAHAAGNHGLGLSIVAGVASMHGGSPFAHCSDNKTSIGFCMPTHCKP